MICHALDVGHASTVKAHSQKKIFVMNGASFKGRFMMSTQKKTRGYKSNKV